jgi:cysteine-rich repeat protein
MRKLTWAVEAFGLAVYSLILPALLAGCLAEPGARCGLGVCAGGKVCDEIHGGCVDPEQLSSCAGQASEAACTAPGIADGACFEGVCFPRGCGNDQLEAGEVCDDGNNLFGDGCSADCTSDETCGNGIIDPGQGEACDDGNNDSEDGCQAECVLPTCGDGFLDELENCDDGAANSNDPDAVCRTNCTPRRCGDGVLDTGEVCDDGNQILGDGCMSDCSSDETCGNGVVDFHIDERCDDSSETLSHDGCGAICQPERTVWRQRQQALPDDRREHALAYDAARGRVVLFGGDALGFSNETWEYDGTSWNERTPSGKNPPARRAPAMAYDARRGRVVLFGGIPNGGGQLDDTWEWDGQNWIDVTPATGSPPARHTFAMTYDAVRGRVVLFGGFVDGSGDLDDTWEWDGSRWTEVTPATGSPPQRFGHAMTYDPARDQVVLFSGFRQFEGLLADTWTWDGTAWTEVTAAAGDPPARSNHGMAYDTSRGHVVMFGGFGFADTWEWDGTGWTEITPATGSPPGRAAPLVFDITRGRAVSFGGQGSGPGSTRLGDTWEWDGAGWAEIVPIVERPPARAFHAVAHDQSRGRVIAFGGSQNGVSLNDTWEWDGATWADVTPAGDNPPARDLHAMAFDSKRRRLVLFGGRSSGVLSDTWEWDGTEWVELAPANNPGPTFGRAMAYDEARGQVVLFKGPSAGGTFTWDGTDWTQQSPASSPTTPGALAYDPTRERVVLLTDRQLNTRSETWEWDGANWTDVTPAIASPSGRSSHQLAFNAARGRLVTFGGNDSFSDPLDDTWEWDGSDWIEISPDSGNPPARRSFGMTYHAASRQVVLFGGIDNNGLLDDTWELSYQISGDPGEACELGALDYDNDGVLGCDDPDCWGRCMPECPPDSTPDWPSDCDTARPHCGDGVCNPFLETQRLCPGDCGPPPEICGDFICEGAEDNASCPGDCTP